MIILTMSPPKFDFIEKIPDKIDNYLSKTLRILLSPDYCEEKCLNINASIIKKYGFKEYTVEGSGIVLISDPIINFTDLEPCFKSMFLTVLKVSEDSSISYKFDGPYLGWWYAAVPFFMFIRGLASLNASFIYGRIVHLSQSSGYGKTRLCFELLKFENCGGYCVYRSGSEGYPKTTPWMQDLVDAFKNSNTELESIIICLKFVEQIFDNFSDFKEDWAGFKKKFEGESLDCPKFNLSISKTDINFESLLLNLKNKLLEKTKVIVFPIIFDECHELLLTPPRNLELISLYRVIRRVFFLLKETKIVGVFLGTKSSLQDFVLRHKNDPSIRNTLDDAYNTIDIPCYAFNQTVDIMLTEHYQVTYESASRTKSIVGLDISYPKILKNIAQHSGRPLWSFYKLFSEAFAVARTKLKCDSTLTDLTCLILRTGSQVISQDDLAHKLVLSGMATLLNIDLEGSRCWVVYVPEPILSNNARIILTSIKALDNAIAVYVRRLQLGSFHDSGTAGELVARIVLLRTMDLVLLRPIERIDESFERNDIADFTYREIIGNDSDQIEKFRMKMNERIVVSASMNFSSEKKSPPLYPSEITASEGPASTSNHPASTSNYPATTSATTSPVDINSTNPQLLVPNIGVSTLREYLMLFADLRKEDLIYFGVSNEVLDGLVNLNQFVQLSNPLKIDQPYLMHFFAKSCGAILSTGAPGADLLFPVLMKDNRMSCVLVQVKNFGSGASFPCNDAEVCGKLTRSFLKFLNLDKVGDFQKVEPDNFVRIVIQLGGSSGTHLSKVWKSIIGSESLQDYGDAENVSLEGGLAAVLLNPRKSARLDIPKTCQVLWLNGIETFKENLFFNHAKIIKNLDTIINGQRNFLDCIDFPEVLLPTKLQTSKEGAEFLSQQAQTLSSHSFVAINDSRLRNSFKPEVESILETMKKLDIHKYSKEYANKFSITPADPKDYIVPFDFKVRSDNVMEEFNNIASKTIIENSNYTQKSRYSKVPEP